MRGDGLQLIPGVTEDIGESSIRVHRRGREHRQDVTYERAVVGLT